MSRLLLIAFFIACSSTPKRIDPIPLRAEITLSAWFGRWVTARKCLVAPARDLLTGVTIAMQKGEDCSSVLGRLIVDVAPGGDAQRDILPVAKELVRMVGRERLSPSKRSALISDLDKLLEALDEVVRDEGAETSQPSP